jgi:ribonuclease Z
MTYAQRSGLALVLGLLAATGCDKLETRIIQRQAARALHGDRTDLVEDGSLHVVLCGTGSPLADPERAGPCTAVLAGGHFFLVDAGPGSQRQVAIERLPRPRLDGILLTHFHSDHIGEVGEAVLQSWVAGRSQPLAVYGPPGVEQVVDGVRQMYTFDTQYRVAHHGAEAMPPAAGVPLAKTVTLPAADGETVVFDADGLKITAFAVDHAPVAPAYGYRFDYRGRSIVISGDTKKSDNLIRHAQGVDLLVHEALAARMIAPVNEYAKAEGLTRWAKLTSDVVNYHTTPVQAAEVAKAANARMLALTHIVPPLPNFIAKRMFMRGVSSVWDGPVELGKDGMHFKLQPGTTAVTVDTLG